MLIDRGIDEFLDELASKSPTPGGGSVAALSGALGAGLVSMVCGLTIGKKGYESVEEEMTRILAESDEIRGEMTKLVDLDAEAFNAIIKAYGFKKSTDEERHIRTEAIQASLRKAAEVPMRVIELAVKALSLASEAGKIGNKNVLSDIAVAGVMLNAAVDAAWFNVSVNLDSIKDEKFCDEMSGRGELLLDEAEELYETVMETVDSRMAG